jgi:hypothetical protein
MCQRQPQRLLLDLRLRLLVQLAAHACSLVVCRR